jgi:hypothetical protein
MFNKITINLFTYFWYSSTYLGAHLGFSSKGITPLKAQVEIFLDDMHQHKKIKKWMNLPKNRRSYPTMK